MYIQHNILFAFCQEACYHKRCIMAKNTEKLYILDGNAILHRAWHALPPLTSRDGMLVNAAYGFLLVLLKLLRDEKPEYLAITFDKAGPTFRHEAYEAYKATRVKQPDELYAQIPILKKVLETMGFSIFEKEGFEADDVIGTIAEKVSKKGIETTIVTGDLDTLQLVRPGVRVFTFARGIKDSVRYDDAAVKARYGLAPSQMIDYKALRGDASDNIKGVRGIGEKTATELLQLFGSLEDVYDAIKKNSPKLKKVREKIIETLRAGEADALQSKDLVTIRCDVPIDFVFGDVKIKPFDREKLAPIFAELGFRSLFDKLPGAETQTTPPRSPSKEGEKIRGRAQGSAPHQKSEIKTILSTDEAKELVGRLKNETEVAIRVWPRPENTFDTRWAGVAVVLPEVAPPMGRPRAWFVPKEFVNELASFFLRKDITIVGHDLKTDWHALHPLLNFSVLSHPRERKIEDLMIASYLLNPGARKHDLGALVFEKFSKELAHENAQGTLLAPTTAHASIVADEECRYILALRPLLLDELKERNQLDLFYKIEMPLIPVLAAMESCGIKIDADYLNEMAGGMKKRITALTKKIYGLSGEEFNINSPAQLKVVLFEKLKIPAHVRKTAGGELSTAAGELEKLRGVHPVIDSIFEYRELSKLVSTYVDALPALVRKDTGRLHTTFNQTITSTGRLSSSDPNLQNIPIRTELGREIRKAFVAERGSVLVAADYSQIELRLAAVIGRVKKMRAAFAENADIHTATAAEVWNTSLEKVTKEQRRAAKAINFGLLYGMGPSSLAEGTGMSFAESKEFVQRYFDVYPEIKVYMDETKAFAVTQGYVETLFGRRRYLPDITSGVPQVRAAAERMAINAPIQGSAADLMKMAMIKIHEWIEKEYGFAPRAPVKMILQVHDELVFEVKKGLALKVGKQIKDSMETTHTLAVPIVVDVEIGKNWGELEKMI